MSRYLRDARRHAEKIRHFYDFAGKNGYKQAIYHWSKLVTIMRSVMRSKNDKNDALPINNIIEKMQPLMDEMKKREIGTDST
jgi:hypothetical protein